MLRLGDIYHAYPVLRRIDAGMFNSRNMLYSQPISPNYMRQVVGVRMYNASARTCMIDINVPRLDLSLSGSPSKRGEGDIDIY